MSSSIGKEYNPYYIMDPKADIDPEGKPNPPMILSPEFLRDINKNQTLKVFKTVTSGFLKLADGSETDLTEITRNLVNSNYKNLMDVVNGRQNATGTKAKPFDDNPISWRDTVIRDDVIICRYFNPTLLPSTTDSLATDELLYFLYDIVEPTGAYQQYQEEDPESVIELKPFTSPIYRVIQSNKIAAIAKVHDVACQLYNYTHNWFYINLKGYDIKCSLIPPLDTEIVSGVPGDEHYPVFHHHTSDCVLVPGVTEEIVTNSRPVNARDFYERAVSMIKSGTECSLQTNMTSRYAGNTDSFSILPSGAIIAPGGTPAMNNDGSQYAKTWNYIKKISNRVGFNTANDKIVDKGV